MDFDANALTTHLETTYGIDAVSATPIEGGHLFRVVRNDGADWVARPFPPERPTARAETDAAILRYLASIDYPAERCAHDEPVSTLGGWTILVTTFVDGQPPGGKAGRANVPVATFGELGSLLGRLHTTELPAELRRPAGSWHGDPAFEGAPREDVHAARSWLAEVEPNVQANGRPALDALRRQIDELDDCSATPHAFVHPDFCAVNAITATDGTETIVDWTGSGWGPRITSLAVLLSQTLGPHAGTLDERVDATLEGYGEHVTLDTDERNLLANAMRIRTVLFGCYTYRIVVQHGQTPLGNEGWWPDHRATDALAEKIAERFGERLGG